MQGKVCKAGFLAIIFIFLVAGWRGHGQSQDSDPVSVAPAALDGKTPRDEKPTAEVIAAGLPEELRVRYLAWRKEQVELQRLQEELLAQITVQTPGNVASAMANFEKLYGDRLKALIQEEESLRNAMEGLPDGNPFEPIPSLTPRQKAHLDHLHRVREQLRIMQNEKEAALANAATEQEKSRLQASYDEKMAAPRAELQRLRESSKLIFRPPTKPDRHAPSVTE